MKDKIKKVYVTGTRDRLFLSKSYDERLWMLVDRRGNVYESSNYVDVIIEHIDNYVKQGIYIAK